MIDETATPDHRLLPHHYLASVFQVFLDHATNNTFVTIEEPDTHQFVQYVHIQFNRDDGERFEAAAEAASSFEAMPEWARDWMLKAEEGPTKQDQPAGEPGKSAT